MNKVKTAFCYYLLTINIVTLIAFGCDKFRAASSLFWSGRQPTRRTSESLLLSCAAVGGTPAAWLAQRLFRHKTRKQPFGRRLCIIAGCQVALLLYYFLST